VSERFLTGRKAWITGGATGIGRAIALALADAGADTAIGSLTESGTLPPTAYAAIPRPEDIEATAETIRRRNVKCYAGSLDVRDQRSVQAFHDQARAQLGSFDILINAAGVSAQEAVVGHTDETWTTVIGINLSGCFRVIRCCFPSMLEQGWGRIVNIASTAAEVGGPRHSAYCASKFGLLGLTRCVALEGAPRGVTCNAINPGSVGTEMMRLGSLRRIAQGGQGATVEENFALIAAAMPQKRLITVEEIASTALYLCRDEAHGINGEAITVSGGALW